MFQPFITLLKQIVEDKSCLEDKKYRTLLKIAAQDFRDFCRRFNGGNDRSYNLNQSGQTLDKLALMCSGFHSFDNIDWEWMLGDVESIAAIVQHEVTFNMVRLNPHPIYKLTDGYGVVREYKPYVAPVNEV